MSHYYSRGDERAIFYVYSILGMVIAVSSYFCIGYNNKQVSKRLKAEGITVYCRVSNLYKQNGGRNTQYYIVLDYLRSGKKKVVDLDVGPNEYSAYHIGDSIILRKLPTLNASSYMKIIGFRSNGSDFAKNY